MTIPRRYECRLCRKRHGVSSRATVRLFSGMSGDGFPTCDLHERETVTEVLQVFDEKHKGPLSDNYKVVAFEVEWDKVAMPLLGRVLWRVTKKAKAV